MKKSISGHVGKIAKQIGNLIVCGVTFKLLNSLNENVTVNYNSSTATGYGAAVEAIMNSDMWSSNKHEAIAALDRKGDTEYFKAVIAVAESTMWSSDKLNTIKGLSR